MSRHPELYQWVDTVVMRFPSLSKPQALGLALWSFGMVLARSCSLTAVADMLAPLMGQSYNTLLETLRDTYREAGAKAGKNASNSMSPSVGRRGWRDYWMAGRFNS